MILKMEVQSVKPGLGARKAGCEIKLADSVKPLCLIPFSVYVADEHEFRAKHGVGVTDLVGKIVDVTVQEFIKSDRGAGLKIEGEIIPKK